MSFACERSGSEQRLVSMPYDVYQRCRPLTILFGITYCTLSLLSCMTAAAFFGGGAHAGHSHFWVNFYFTQFILFALASLVMVYRTPSYEEDRIAIRALVSFCVVFGTVVIEVMLIAVLQQAFHGRRQSRDYYVIAQPRPRESPVRTQDCRRCGEPRPSSFTLTANTPPFPTAAIHPRLGASAHILSDRGLPSPAPRTYAGALAMPL